MGLTINGDSPVAVDTSVFIYYIEEHESFLPIIEPLFITADSGGAQLITSAITLLELLVAPYRKENAKLAARYEELMNSSRGIRMVDIDRSQLRAAAHLRAAYRLRIGDALQIAAALATRCTVFLTNDLRLPKIRGLRIVQLNDLI
jgi:predicted nucleic acid-binding protein